MVFVKFSGGNGYRVCDFEEYVKFDSDVDEDFLNDYLNDLVHDNAETFSYVATEWDGD